MALIQGVTRYKASVDVSPAAIGNRRVMLHELKNGVMRYLGMKISDSFGNYSFGEPKSIYSREYYVTALDEFGIPWEADLAVIVGDRIRPSGAFAGYVYEVTTSGNLGSTEPTWPTVHGDSVNAGTAVLEAWEFAQPESHGPFVAAPEPTAWLALCCFFAKSGPWLSTSSSRLYLQTDPYNTPIVYGDAGLNPVTVDKDDIFTSWPTPASDVVKFAQSASTATTGAYQALPDFEYFSIDQEWFAHARNSTWNTDWGEMTAKFMDVNGNEIISMVWERYNTFGNRLYYKLGGVTLFTAPSTGSYPSTWARITFTANSIIFTTIQTSGSNGCVQSHTYVVDLSACVKVQFSGRAQSSYTGGTDGGSAVALILLLNPEVLP